MSDTKTAPQTTAATNRVAPLIIAIDGPSGAGKSTLGRRLAARLGLLYLDTGAMYRAVALAILRDGIELTDTAAVARRAREVFVELVGEPDRLQILLDGKDVSDGLRTQQVAHAASVVSTNSEVRRELVRRQREMALNAERGVVLDGRDIGTVVFPDAPIKFFLTATPEQRATRRLKESDEEAGYNDILRDIQERDARDSTRADSPLSIAEDAVVIDSTEEGIEDVLERMVAVVRERRK